MSEFRVEVRRFRQDPNSMIGQMFVNGTPLCFTLELPWRDNRRSESCVPNGTYQGILRYDKGDRWRIQLTGVPGGREGVQIHIGNYPEHTKGCVLVGTGNSTDQVIHSTAAYGLLMNAFYGSATPLMTPNTPITVSFTGTIPTVTAGSP